MGVVWCVRVLGASVSEVCVCVPAHLVSISPPTLGNRTRTGASPGSRCVGRSTGTGHELPRSLFLSSPISPPPQLLCSAPALAHRQPGRHQTASYSSHLKPPKTLPIISYAFCLVPCASLKCLTTAILPRPYQYKSFLPCFFSSVLPSFPFPPPQDEASDRTDRPTDARPGFHQQDHGMRVDGGFCVRRPAVSSRRLSR